MAAGTASWGDISGTANYIHENAMAVARMAAVLAPTVSQAGGTGMFLRRVWEWNALAFTTHTEETDEASTLFDKDHIAVLTPVNYHCRADITDERATSDPDSAKAAAALELGSAAAAHIDTNIGTLFGTTSG